MDEWENFLDEYPREPDVKCFIKMLKKAEVSLKTDLATFEAEWIINTLFFQPIKLFDTVTLNSNKPPWTKPLADSFKLISFIVDKYTPDDYYENIVTLCLLQYCPMIRKDALSCLTRVSLVSSEGAKDISRLVSELESATTCKAQLAVHIGTVCEHHPALVVDLAERVWRVYLNMLDCTKNTATVLSAILTGLNGLLSQFGNSLPTREFRTLYEHLTGSRLLDGCTEACLKLLERHAPLFKELLLPDASLRARLWQLDARAAVRAVYHALAQTGDRLETISASELIPRASSPGSGRLTALRVLRHYSRTRDVTVHVRDDVTDAAILEAALRGGRVSLEIADEIQWSIESNASYSDKLLQTAVLCYDNIPAAKRKAIVVDGLANASDDLRTTTVSLLLSSSLGDQLPPRMSLWRDLVGEWAESPQGSRPPPRAVIDDVVELVTEAVAREEGEMSPRLLSLVSAGRLVVQLCPQAERVMSRAGRRARTLLGGGGAVERGRTLRIDKCRDDTSLCECCEQLIHAPLGAVDDKDVLTAIQILLTRRDVEFKLLSLTLERLETLLIAKSCAIEQSDKDNVISLVVKLRSRLDNSKDARILRRDIIMFLGKFGNNNYHVPQTSDENTILAELGDSLTLNIPNTEDGTFYRLNLKSIIRLAIIHQDRDTLEKLLSIACASLSTRRNHHILLTLTLIIRALCRTHSSSAMVQQAVLMCDHAACLNALITFISEEKSPGVRRMLSDALQGLLLQQPGTPNWEALLTIAAQQAIVMMTAEDVTTIVRSGGLTITETVLSVLKNHYTEQVMWLPRILTLILATNDPDAASVFGYARTILIDNQSLYSKETILSICNDLSYNLLLNNMDLKLEAERKIYKDKVTATFDLLKELREFNSDVLYTCCEKAGTVGCKAYVLAWSLWPVSDGLVGKMVGELKGSPCDHLFVVESSMKFLEVHRVVLMGKFKEDTLQSVGNIITNMPPDIIIELKKQLLSFTTAYNTEDAKFFIDQYKRWYQHYDLQKILNSITADNIEVQNSNVLKALNIYLELLKIPSYQCHDSLFNLCDVALAIFIKCGERNVYVYKEYMSDMLTVSLRCKSQKGIGVFILKGCEEVGMAFLKYFMDCFLDYLLKKPFVLFDERRDLEPVHTVLNDVMTAFMKRKYTDEQCVSMLELMDALWPTYSQKATLVEKQTLLLQCSRLSVRPDGDVFTSRVTEVMRAGGAGKTRLTSVLPGGEMSSLTYLLLASALPARLSEMTGEQHSIFRSLIDSYAATVDGVLLVVLMKICHSNRTPGWWDEALTSCAASIARRGACVLRRAREQAGAMLVSETTVDVMSIAREMYEYKSIGVTNRLLIPLLRYSSGQFCCRFFGSILSELLAELKRWVRGDRDTPELRELMRGHVRAFSLIALALEKIPLASLKSPDSELYSGISQPQPSHLMRKSSALCVTLRKKRCGDGEAGDFAELTRQWQAANYKCLCAAVCVSRPAAKFYDALLEPEVWQKVFQCEREWDLPLRNNWSSHKSVHAVSWGADADAAHAGEGSARTRMFLRTLSEDPLRFDLMDGQEAEEQETPQEMELAVNELNSQECADTLTELLRHLASLAATDWLARVTATLTGPWHKNVKWTLAQAIVNCADELQAHARTLAPPLARMLLATPRPAGAARVLSELHKDVLNTLIKWSAIPTGDGLAAAMLSVVITTGVADGPPARLGPLLQPLAAACGPHSVALDFPKPLAPDAQKSLVKILLTIIKQDVKIPELLPMLSDIDIKLYTQDIRLPELYGWALARASETERYVAKYKSWLDRVRQSNVADYVKMLYYAQIGYPKMCDEYNFVKIMDLTPKMQGPLRAKCLLTLKSHVSWCPASRDAAAALDMAAMLASSPLETLGLVEALGGSYKGCDLARSYCDHADVKLRLQAVKVLAQWFEEVVCPPDGPPPAKRSRGSPALLRALGGGGAAARALLALAPALSDRAPAVAARARGAARVGLWEAFILTICIPAKQTSQGRSLQGCVAAFLELALRGVRAGQGFKAARLREEPLDMGDLSAMPFKLLTNTRSYQGTFLSSMSSKPKAKSDANLKGIDVQLPIDDILETLISFAKDKPDVAQTLCVEMVQAFIANIGPPPFEVCEWLCAGLGVVGELTPLLVELATTTFLAVRDCVGFESNLFTIQSATRCTDGQDLVQILSEEVQLHDDPTIFNIGIVFDDGPSIIDDDAPIPHLEDMVHAFGKLSNWDSLSEQRKRDIRSILPQIAVSDQVFRSWVEDYHVPNTKSWFDKLVSVYRDECKRDGPRWLRQMDRFPRSSFHASVVMEALTDVHPSDIQPEDCLIEWHARLTMRRSFAHYTDSERAQALPSGPEPELVWAREANRRGLARFLLNCRDCDDSAPGMDRLAWQIEKLAAMATIGVNTGDEATLLAVKELADNLEKFTRDVSRRDIIAMNNLKLSLMKSGVISLDDETVREIVKTVGSLAKGARLDKDSKNMLCSLYGAAISHYDTLWENNTVDENMLVCMMADVVGHVGDLQREGLVQPFLSLVCGRLRRLPPGRLQLWAARALRDKAAPLLPRVDPTCVSQLTAGLRPAPAVADAWPAVDADAPGMRDLTHQFSLVCDMGYTLMRRLGGMLQSIEDPVAWKTAFKLLKAHLFENPYAVESPEFGSLSKYKEDLYDIENYVLTDPSHKKAVLTPIITELRNKTTVQPQLRMSQLCPSLARHVGGRSDKDACMSRFLGLGKLHVVRFEDQLPVFTDAVSRPVLLSMLLSDGSSRRLVCKMGDRPRLDAAALRAPAYALLPGVSQPYQVIPLGDDGGLIEYVENTHRLRALINRKKDLSDVDIGARAEDEELVVASSSLELHEAYCDLVPANILRSCILSYSSCMEDFICKKKMYLETLSTTVLWCWLFGLGDRHLDNLLFSSRDGSLVCVDWAALLQYGGRELPPARLTRNVLAVLDPAGHSALLEARLQQLMTTLRASHKLFLSHIESSFDWMGQEFYDKFQYIQDLVVGRTTCRHVTARSLAASGRRHADRLLRLLDEVFEDLEEADTYSVPDQVTCLFRLSTDPKILSVTRSGWEPWV